MMTSINDIRNDKRVVDMTAPIAPPKCLSGALLGYFLTVLLLLSCVLFVSYNDSSERGLESSNDRHRQLRRIHGIFNDQQAFVNANRMKQWRQDYEEMCNDPLTTKESLLEELDRIAKPSLIHSGTHEDSLPIQPCRQVFLDFGANVGDSLQKFISSGIPKCVDKLPNHHPSFNATTGGASQSFRGGGNPLVSWSWNRMNHYSSLSLQPEDYCYYGIEGNPIFSELLKNLERNVMRMNPRPVRRAHFLTETVGAGKDGPTTLYLDTINVEKNVWGSSLLSQHKDIQASALEHGGRSTAQVQGMTLGTLLKQVIPEKRGMHHVMIKMDIEGGEFQVLEQAAADGTVCDILKQGVRIDMILEGHNEEITGTRTQDEKDKFEKARDKLVKCGLNLWFVKDAGR